MANNITIVWIRHGEKEYNNSGFPDSGNHRSNKGAQKCSGPLYDAGLTQRGVQDANDAAYKAVDAAGYPMSETLYNNRLSSRCFQAPKLIFTSPFARARQTAEIIANVLEATSGEVAPAIYTAREVGEYLGYQGEKILKETKSKDTSSALAIAEGRLAPTTLHLVKQKTWIRPDHGRIDPFTIDSPELNPFETPEELEARVRLFIHSIQNAFLYPATIYVVTHGQTIWAAHRIITGGYPTGDIDPGHVWVSTVQSNFE